MGRDHDKSRASAPTQFTEVLTFKPTIEEFSNFSKYVAYMESVGAHKAGIAKVIPPKEWIPRKKGYNVDNLAINVSSPLKQKITPANHDGAYHVQSIAKQLVSIQVEFALNES